MKLNTNWCGSMRPWRWGLIGTCIAAVVFATGCPNGSTPAGTGSGAGGTSTSDGTGSGGGMDDSASGAASGAKIVNVLTTQEVSLLVPFISILYTVPDTGAGTTISAFYVAVNSTGVDAVEIPPRIPIVGATNLPAGTNQAFRFVPAEAKAGLFKVGLTIATGATSVSVLSAGVIRVQGPPQPMFLRPTEPVTEIEQGDTITISFDAGDREGQPWWRLFFVAASDPLEPLPSGVPVDELGTQLAVDVGNAGMFSWGTSGLAPGRYEIGLSATDSGDSVSATVARGDEDLISTIPNENTSPEDRRVIVVKEAVQPVPPSISFLAPGSSDVQLFGNEAFTIQLQVTLASPELARMDVFYDTDADIGNGFNAIFGATNVPVPASATSFAFPTNLPEGVYRVGATVRQGTLSPVTAFAAGSVNVVRTPTLIVTAPNSAIPIKPMGAGGGNDTVTVSWTTNVPSSAGTVDVFARSVDAVGVAFGPEIPVLEPTSTSVTSVAFSSELSGTFEITVRIDFNDSTLDAISEAAPQFVRVSSAPAILWLGSLATSEPVFDGAVFEGVNTEDNAGSSLNTAGDLDGDGLDEFVIGARYGKPFFINPSGIGPGEAYLVYGSSGGTRKKGVFNLNSLGTTALRGVLLTGIRTDGDNDDTDGLSDITLIPDADGDLKGELAFGFPRTDSAGQTVGPLEASGQFLNGGVVILSSENSILREPLGGTPVIGLGACGQTFSDMTTTADSLLDVLADSQRFDDATSLCIAGTDAVDDTVIGPSEGFIPLLARPAYNNPAFGFTLIEGGATPAEGVCSTQFDLVGCVDSLGQTVFGASTSGSGFYPTSAVAQEPLGARVLGQSAGDGFGASIGFSNAMAGDTTDLIISAPNRSASSSFVDGIATNVAGSGVAFLAPNRDLWGIDNSVPGGATPPTPHQYVMGVSSHCGDGRAPSFDPLRIAGDINDGIENVIGIDDFNGDARNDFAAGAPTANGGQGRVYIAFRREKTVEGDFVLGKLALDPNDSGRLTGVLIVTNTIDGLGSSLATGVDFNGDGVTDLVIGSPDANGGQGAVLVVFGDPSLTSPLNGITVDTLLNTRNTQGQPRAARIEGNALDVDGRFGFNVANAGDIDGDGLDDLLVAAPGATPRFDPDPIDDVDEFTEPGIDANLDGVKDDVSGPSGLPDVVIDTFDNLDQAGLVYVIFGSNRLDELPAADLTVNIDQLGGNTLSGFLIAGRRAGDRIGGGDAGDTGNGGVSTKTGRGRSNGLASAGDVDGDGRADILIGAVLADPRRDPNTGVGVQNAGEAYLIYGSVAP